MEIFETKLEKCRDELKKYKKLAIAFSGGTDSTLLLKLAADTLGRQNVLAVTVVSQFQHAEEIARARKLPLDMGVELLEISCDVLEDPAISDNTPQRCYHCKKTLFSKIIEAAETFGADKVASAANFDDLGDYRPGLQAEKELDILQPFVLAALTKDEIRKISDSFNLPTAWLPSNACLASRIPYNTPITFERLARIERAETVMRQMGFEKVRVRDHETVARIEVSPQNIQKVLTHRDEIIDELKSLGYRYVTVDLEGFRSGSMNETLE